MPRCSAKSYKSKLFHSHLCRNLLLSHLIELPIQREFKRLPYEQQRNYAEFKKQWLAKFNKARDPLSQTEKAKRDLKKQQKEQSDQDGQIVNKEFIGLDTVRQKLYEQAEEKRNLKELSKVTLILNKDQGELLIDTTYEEDLSKHGMKPYVRWGVLKETLAAACILESGILQRAQKTGKLYVWDPFCGSGSFLLESLMAGLEQPVRSLDHCQWPFQNWPIHSKEQFQEFNHEMNEIKKIEKHLDIQLIGSDISLKAIQTSTSNADFADLDQYLPLINPQERNIINDPLTYAAHYPQDKTPGSQINFQETRRRAYLSFYHGDFQKVGNMLAPLTDNFEDFTLLMNVPYGVQSAERQRMTERDNQNLYRRLGRFLDQFSPSDTQKPISPRSKAEQATLEENIGIQTESKEVVQSQAKEDKKPKVFVLAKARHYGHDLSFEKYTNCAWQNVLHFNNGGLSVNLLKLQAKSKKASAVKQTLSAYKQLGSPKQNLNDTRLNKRQIHNQKPEGEIQRKIDQ